MRPLRVFLDSSDYSVLSDPARLTSEIQDTYDYLLTLVELGRVKCYFTGSILSEMAPLDSTHATEALRRVSVLVRLCGTNALVSIDRLFAYELANAHNLPPRLRSVHSNNGEWFPNEALDFLPVSEHEQAQEIMKIIEEAAPNRQARRNAKLKLMKHGKPRANVSTEIAMQARTIPLNDLLQKIPMKPEYARVMARFFARDATLEEAKEAFSSSLSDPRWVIQWISQEQNLLSEFSGILRNPAAEMTQVISLLADHAKLIRFTDSTIGTGLSDELLSSDVWRARQDTILANIANGISANNLETGELKLAIETIEQKCPGLSVAVRSLFSAWWSATTAIPRQPKLSDFPDAVHAAYAPYVDLFRADSFMAPHIARQAKRLPVKIVPKFAKLRSMLELSLKELSANE